MSGGGTQLDSRGIGETVRMVIVGDAEVGRRIFWYEPVTLFRVVELSTHPPVAGADQVTDWVAKIESLKILRAPSA